MAASLEKKERGGKWARRMVQNKRTPFYPSEQSLYERIGGEEGKRK